ncbi:DUF4031 domain-containing protein [Methylobacterium gnaphalii]|uniref:DUF4031 domain-containing protein n=1 Tax=Methylobacterium gnaphalii TaxID=1010610 RepID=A0A512JQY0_9HYPH|nr:DUF4031 domain-containing protein [Methylobacterium gnaphalii]GEP12273.1 hypothetical protein MGN01_41180 [Methylobacterium gnaphalii]GJD68724.1 hypothetical protein MMMDOFMJ_1648 [Methylobacterium gnaphalii]GLS49380.1 hypothetical protein GCM10007885_22280 [Methylobacterium gnaphalii]
MPCYVDDVEHSFGNMKMCHLWADTEAELLAMVDAIGVQRKWMQRPPKASWVHFDIAKSKKARAILLGAILTDRYGPLEHVARLDIASGEPARVIRGQKRIGDIEAARLVRQGEARP